MTQQPELSMRRRQVLDGVSRGMGIDEIAAELYLSRHTVKTHLKLALRQLQAHDRAHAVRICFERGIFPMPRREAS